MHRALAAALVALWLCTAPAAADQVWVVFLTDPPHAAVHLLNRSAPLSHDPPQVATSDEKTLIDTDGPMWHGPLTGPNGIEAHFEVEFRKPGFKPLRYSFETHLITNPKNSALVTLPAEGGPLALAFDWSPANLPHLLDVVWGRALCALALIAALGVLWALRRRTAATAPSAPRVIPTLDFDPLVGHVLAGYEIMQRLGRGGMADVYEVRRGNETYAMKLIHPEIAANMSAQARFKHEIQITSKLQHPNIVRVFDWGIEGERSYLVMELLDGQTLGDVIGEKPIPLPRTLELVRRIVEALCYAHEHGVVHRDFKPDNVMVTSKGLKVMDFGLARTPDATKVTVSGHIMGTPAYLAPEQVMEHELTPAVDQYALGIVIFEMLTGKPPFDSENPHTVMMKHAHFEPPHLPDAAAAVDPVVQRMLAKTPEARYADLREALAAFETAAQG